MPHAAPEGPDVQRYSPDGLTRPRANAARPGAARGQAPFVYVLCM